MTDLIKMERGKGVYVLTLHRFPCFGASEAVCSTTYYLPSRMSVRLMVKMYQAEEQMCALMRSHRWFRSWLLKRDNGKVIAGRMWF